jgi:hypothetical protein
MAEVEKYTDGSIVLCETMLTFWAAERWHDTVRYDDSVASL